MGDWINYDNEFEGPIKKTFNGHVYDKIQDLFIKHFREPNENEVERGDNYIEFIIYLKCRSRVCVSFCEGQFSIEFYRGYPYTPPMTIIFTKYYLDTSVYPFNNMVLVKFDILKI